MVSHTSVPVQADPAFPETEHRERLARARRALA